MCKKYKNIGTCNITRKFTEVCKKARSIVTWFLVHSYMTVIFDLQFIKNMKQD